MNAKTLVAFFSFFLFSGISLASFSDVSPHYLYADEIQNLEDQGKIKGFSDGTFRPSQGITRAEFTKILLLSRYSPSEISECHQSLFKDVSEDAWYGNYICFAKEKGIVRGYEGGVFRPEQNIIFSEAAKIIVTTFFDEEAEGSGDDWWKPFVQKLEQENALPPTVGSPHDDLRRGEMAFLISTLEEKNPIPKEEAVEKEEKTVLEESLEEPSLSKEEVEEKESPEGKEEYASADQKISFSYESLFEEQETVVFEKGTHIAVGIPRIKTSGISDCLDAGLCQFKGNIPYDFIDGFFLLSKTEEESFEDAIKRKITESGGVSDSCVLQSSSEGEWTRILIFSKEFEEIVKGNLTPEERIAADKKNQEDCGFYAAGFGNTSFLFSPEKSKTRFLYRPSYAQEKRAIDYEGLVFSEKVPKEDVETTPLPQESEPEEQLKKEEEVSLSGKPVARSRDIYARIESKMNLGFLLKKRSLSQVPNFSFPSSLISKKQIQKASQLSDFYFSVVQRRNAFNPLLNISEDVSVRKTGIYVAEDGTEYWRSFATLDEADFSLKNTVMDFWEKEGLLWVTVLDNEGYLKYFSSDDAGRRWKNKKCVHLEEGKGIDDLTPFVLNEPFGLYETTLLNEDTGEREVFVVHQCTNVSFKLPESI